MLNNLFTQMVKIITESKQKTSYFTAFVLLIFCQSYSYNYNEYQMQINKVFKYFNVPIK